MTTTARGTGTPSPSFRDHLLEDERVDPTFRRKARAVLQDVRGHGLPLVVVEVYRTVGRQRMYYAQGRTDDRLRRLGYTDRELAAYRRAGYTADKPKITYTMKPTAHGEGRAMDCAWLIGGTISWNAPLDWWQKYGSSAKAHGLTWGGDWKMRDYSHVEWRGGT